MMKSMSPRASIAVAARPACRSTYRKSVNPSARISSSATYCGAMQMPGDLEKRTVVVSSGPPGRGPSGANQSGNSYCRETGQEAAASLNALHRASSG